MNEHWIVPCNTRNFNIIEHFKIDKSAVWKNSFTIKEGDIVYLYLSAPYSEIRFRCRVISTEVSDEMLQKHSYAIVQNKSNNYFSKKIKYMVIEKEIEYPEGLLSLDCLKKNGLGQVQIQARTDRQVQKYIDELTAPYETGGDE